ncbi:MAG: RluA family pseudouridine synthase [Candidatus Wallbacteria bacterium]|nr:RluA family pseudouridine synthase [Candidatus Wallbacteria bacterium]
MVDPMIISVNKPEGRVDLFLARQFPDFSRNMIQQMIRDGFVLINTGKTKSQYRLRPGDEISLTIPPRKITHLSPEDIPLNIVYEDSDVIVIDKQRGMVVHPACSHESGTLVNALIHHFRRLAEGSDPLRPGIIHRLDKGTSGLMLVCKSDRMMTALSRQFHERSIEKQYLAIVAGHPATPCGRIEMPLSRDSVQRKKMMVSPEGKTAITVYRLRTTFTNYSLLSIDLLTGRTHQIRVHLSYLKLPIVNDTLYGYRGEQFDINGPALHAERIAFQHPFLSRHMEFQAPLPEDMKNILAALKGSV